MTEEQQKKYKRMQDRVNELDGINEKIARLAFYINENDVEEDLIVTLDSQLDAMKQYRDILQERIVEGKY